jgi:hypothetical protein
MEGARDVVLRGGCGGGGWTAVVGWQRRPSGSSRSNGAVRVKP